jgi:hypothetical protein
MAVPNWSAIQPRYEDGETPEDLAKAFKCDAQKIRNRAWSQGWNKTKQADGGKRKASPDAKPAAHTRPSEKPRPQVAAHVSAATATVSVSVLEPDAYLEQHRDDWQGLRTTAIKLLGSMDHLDPNAQARQLSAIATALKLVQDGQRKGMGIKDGELPQQASDDDQPTDYSKLSDAELADLHLSEARRTQGSGT